MVFLAKTRHLFQRTYDQGDRRQLGFTVTDFILVKGERLGNDGKQQSIFIIVRHQQQNQVYCVIHLVYSICACNKLTESPLDNCFDFILT